MTQTGTDLQETLERLEAALQSPTIAPSVSQACESLVRRLRRPVRIGIFGGNDAALRARLVTLILGDDVLPADAPWPTVKISYGETPRTKVTLSDGSLLTEDALPSASILANDPAFVQIEMPSDMLRRMTFLHPAASSSPREQIAALNWAARRTDISVWCTGNFDRYESEIWARAPEALKNHAYLVCDAPGKIAPDEHPRDFTGSLALPALAGTPTKGSTAGAKALLNVLNAQIDAAIGEDLDAAKIMLHRFSPTPAKPQKAAGIGATPYEPETVARNAVLSEPFIYLRRRSRNIFETLEWHDGTSDDWASELLDLCSETASGLLDRTLDWPDDDPAIRELRDLVNEALELTVLLQAEGGAEQACEAAQMMCQLRNEFECRLDPQQKLAS